MTSTLAQWVSEGGRSILALVSASFYPGHVGITTAVRPLRGAVAVVQAHGERAMAEHLVDGALSATAPDQQGFVWDCGQLTKFTGPLCLPGAAVLSGEGWVFAGNLLTEAPTEAHLQEHLAAHADMVSTVHLAQHTLASFASLPPQWSDSRGLRSVGLLALDTAKPEDVLALRVDLDPNPLPAMDRLLAETLRYRSLGRSIGAAELEAYMNRGSATDVDLVFSWLLEEASASDNSALVTKALVWLSTRQARLADLIRARMSQAGGGYAHLS